MEKEINIPEQDELFSRRILVQIKEIMKNNPKLGSIRIVGDKHLSNQQAILWVSHEIEHDLVERMRHE